MARPAIGGERGQESADRGIASGTQICREVGWRSSGHGSKQLQVRGISSRPLRGPQCRVSALGLSPNDEAGATGSTGDPARGTDCIQCGVRRFDTPKVGMGRGAAEPRIVGGHYHEPASDCVREAGGGGKEVGAAGRSALLGDTPCSMRPSENGSWLRRNRFPRSNNHAGHLDWPTSVACRPIADTPGLGAARRLNHRVTVTECAGRCSGRRDSRSG